MVVIYRVNQAGAVAVLCEHSCSQLVDQIRDKVLSLLSPFPLFLILRLLCLLVVSFLIIIHSFYVAASEAFYSCERRTKRMDDLRGPGQRCERDPGCSKN